MVKWTGSVGRRVSSFPAASDIVRNDPLDGRNHKDRNLEFGLKQEAWEDSHSSLPLKFVK